MQEAHFKLFEGAGMWEMWFIHSLNQFPPFINLSLAVVGVEEEEWSPVATLHHHLLLDPYRPIIGFYNSLERNQIDGRFPGCGRNYSQDLLGVLKLCFYPEINYISCTSCNAISWDLSTCIIHWEGPCSTGRARLVNFSLAEVEFWMCWFRMCDRGRGGKEHSLVLVRIYIRGVFIPLLCLLALICACLLTCSLGLLDWFCSTDWMEYGLNPFNGMGENRSVPRIHKNSCVWSFWCT